MKGHFEANGSFCLARRSRNQSPGRVPRPPDQSEPVSAAPNQAIAGTLEIAAAAALHRQGSVAASKAMAPELVAAVKAFSGTPGPASGETVPGPRACAKWPRDAHPGS